MSVFADKKFESLDWISAATEPFESKMNELLVLLPEEEQVDFDKYLKLIGDSWNMDLSLRDAVRYLLNKSTRDAVEKYNKLSWEQQCAIQDCFCFSVSGQPVLDFTEKTIRGGTLNIVKIQHTLEESTLKRLLGAAGINSLHSFGLPQDACARMNDIMDLIGGCESYFKTKSTRRKKYAIVDRLKKIFAANEWNIKDADLADKVGFWVGTYISKGDLSAFANLGKLKVMTHSGNPIYSIEEIT